MFSVTKTGMKSFPLWTWKVRPTNSGVIIERRDQVLMTPLLPTGGELLDLPLEAGVDVGPLRSERHAI